MCARWVLVSNGDMGVCWIGVGEEWRWNVRWVNANQQWRHVRVLEAAEVSHCMASDQPNNQK